MLGNHKVALKFTTQMMEHAQNVKDAEKIAITHWLQGTLYFYLGKLISSLEQLNKMNSYYIPEKCSHLKYINGYDPGLMSGITTACVLWALGYPEQATQLSQKMLTAARLIDHSMNLVSCLALDSLTNILRRDYPRLVKQGKEMYDLSKKNGFMLFIGAGLFKIGFAFIHQGKVEEGIKNLHQALDVYNTTGMGFTRTELLGSLAEAYGIYGDLAKAMDFMEQALTEVQRGGEQYYEAELYRIKGELILKRADDKNRKEVEKEAEECFNQSLKVAREQMAKSFELRTSVSLCRLLKKQDKKEEARQLLTKIYNWFTEGFEESDLKEAKVLLEDLNSAK
jgi:predicted ATPase